MAKENNKTNSQPTQDKDISAFDVLAKKILSIVDSGYSERTRLNSQNSKFQSIIDRELDIAKGVSQNNIVDFIISLNQNPNNKKNNMNPEIDTSTLFTGNIGDIYNYFQDVYKNRYLEMTDLKFISKFIPALGEAVKTTLDAIVSSDDISETITRNILLGSSVDADSKTQILNEITRFEKELKLLKKLRNVVYKKTLITGKYYVYAVSYKELFETYSKNRSEGKYGKVGGKIIPSTKISSKAGFNNNKATESEDISNILDMTSAIESVTEILKEGLSAQDAKDIPKIKTSLEKSLPTIIYYEDDYLYSALEGVGALVNNNFNGKDFSKVDINTIMTADGTKDINEHSKEETFNIAGTYIKYIESKNIVPVRIMNQTIGYYHIHATTKNSKRGRNTNNGSYVSPTSSIFSSVNMTENKKEEAINSIVNTIAEGIINKFSSKFVEDNTEYKQMIADCIISNGLIDNDYMIQFIPANHIVEFVINEDEDGNGESILSDSLFPAKLLLSLIICKMLTYMNKSGNKTLAHVYKGPIDINSSNQLNRVVRMMQESNITFNDLLSTNMVFSKFTRDSNIALPTAKNGNKLVEMETMEGQQVELKTDFEDKLEQMAILGTGVPNVILEYVNQIDFAKQIVSANIKFAGRVASLDQDLEEPTTKLYKILINNSNLDSSLKGMCNDTLVFKLPRPRALSNANNADFIQNLQSNANATADMFIGSNAENDIIKTKTKDIMVREMVIANSPFLDWPTINAIYEKAKIEASKEEEIKKDDETAL